jgi:HlyD family secretion protein
MSIPSDFNARLESNRSRVAPLLAKIGHSFAPLGLRDLKPPTHGLRRGLHSCAATRLVRGRLSWLWRRSICFTLGTALLFLSGCSKEAGPAEPIVAVQVAPVGKTTIEHTVTAQAVLFPLAQSAIVPKISAPVKTFLVKRGSRVRQGELLAVLEHQDLAAAAQDTKGTYDQAQATYEISTGADLPAEMQKAQLEMQAAKQLLDAQQKVFDSRQELFQQGALPRKELDQSRVDLTQARNQYEMAQKHLEAMQAIGKQQTLKSAAGQLASAKGKYLGAAAQLSYSEIRSPINGVVTDRPLYAGELATANQPLLTVMDLSKLIAKAHIAQSEAAFLKVGNPAELRVAGLDDAVKGRVTLVSPALDPGSTTIEVWVEASKPDPALRPGMTVNLSITAKTVKDAIVVPTSAVFKSPEGADIVLLASSDGHAHVKTVQIGVRASDHTQIVSGIHAGDQVITSGGYALPDNTAIKIETRAPAEKDAGAKGDKADKASDPGKPAEKDKE